MTIIAIITKNTRRQLSRIHNCYHYRRKKTRRQLSRYHNYHHNYYHYKKGGGCSSGWSSSSNNWTFAPFSSRQVGWMVFVGEHLIMMILFGDGGATITDITAIIMQQPTASPSPRWRAHWGCSCCCACLAGWNQTMWNHANNSLKRLKSKIVL